jgi:hypothetical protein
MLFSLNTESGHELVLECFRYVRGITVVDLTSLSTRLV